MITPQASERSRQSSPKLKSKSFVRASYGQRHRTLNTHSSYNGSGFRGFSIVIRIVLLRLCSRLCREVHLQSSRDFPKHMVLSFPAAYSKEQLFPYPKKRSIFLKNPSTSLTYSI